MMSAKLNSLLSPSDVADLAGVSRPVVSNWRKRHSDFPSAVAGTEAKPLFARDAVVGWLRQRGHKVDVQSAGGQLWSALNAIRDRVPLEDAADFVLLLATVKRMSESEFDRIAHEPSAGQGALLVRAASKLRTLRGLEGTRDPAEVVLRLQPIASLVVEAVRQTSADELASAVDYVLERLSRGQIKGGAESGFIGSRTSALLASLVGQGVGTVYDPACGIANVLVRVSDQGATNRLVGSDVDRGALLVAQQRAFLRGASIDFVAGDVLAVDPDPKLRADVVVVEPPFGMSWDPSAILVDPRFAFGIPPKMASDLAWIQHAIAHLGPDGRAYVLTAPGALFRSGAERKIRANLLSAGCVEAVVGLPPKMLPHTSIGLALWVLRSRRDATDVLLIDARSVDDVESKAAAWLSRDASAPADIAAPHALVPVNDLLAADAVLTPAKWVGAIAIDAGAIAASFASALQAIQQSIRSIGNSSLALKDLAGLPMPRIATIRELIDNGVIELRMGRPDKTRDLDDAVQARIVRATDVKSRHLPTIADLASIDHPDVTAQGDVLVTTMNEVRAVVDDLGGHLPSTGVDRLRIVDRSVLSPNYLAVVLTGSWNARLQTGTTIKRAPIRDLEVPLVPKADQAKVVTAQLAVARLREQSETLSAEGRNVQEAILDSLRYDVPLGEKGLTGRYGSDEFDDEDTK